MPKPKINVKNSLTKLLVVILASWTLLPVATAHAAQITGRKFTLSNSAGAGTGVGYTFNSSALPTTGTAVQSVAAAACDAASGSCVTPTGFTSAPSSLASQPSGLGCASGWTNSTAVTGSLRITATCASTPSGAVTITWSGVTNPTAQNTTFYLRVTTYSDTAWTTSIDSGTIAVSTAQQISVSADVNESLTFCIGTSGITTTSCAGATGSTVSLGTLSASSTNSGTSQMGVGTNASSGYTVTVNGATLTCGGCSGTPTIAAMATQAVSSIGTEQFGLNLRDNATPNVGADPDGSGSGAPTANYNTVDQYRFVTVDGVASYTAGDLFRRYTASYIANITTATEAGTYTATMTYICTATF